MSAFLPTVEIKGVLSEELVPGDLLIIPSTGLVLPCDAVLISGQAIVNEANLTGKSVFGSFHFNSTTL